MAEEWRRLLSCGSGEDEEEVEKEEESMVVMSHFVLWFLGEKQVLE